MCSHCLGPRVEMRERSLASSATVHVEGEGRGWDGVVE